MLGSITRDPIFCSKARILLQVKNIIFRSLMITNRLLDVVQGSTLTVARLPGASEMRLRASENGTQLASENYSVICSIPEEQND